MTTKPEGPAPEPQCRNCSLPPIAHRKPDADGHRRCPTPEGLWAETWFQFSHAEPQMKPCPQCEGRMPRVGDRYCRHHMSNCNDVYTVPATAAPSQPAAREERNEMTTEREALKQILTALKGSDSNRFHCIEVADKALTGWTGLNKPPSLPLPLIDPNPPAPPSPDRWDIPDPAPSQPAREHVHRCMRCYEEFACKTPGVCQAKCDVMPNIVTADGQIVEHCPMNPDWDWIRAYGIRRAAQQTAAKDAAHRSDMQAMKGAFESLEHSKVAVERERDNYKMALEHIASGVHGDMEKGDAVRIANKALKAGKDEQSG